MSATTSNVPGPGAAPPDPDRWHRRLITGVFLTPAAVLLVVWLVYPTANTFVRSFFDRTGEEFVGIDNYEAIFSTPTLTKAIENNALWVAVVPILVTAIGLVLAVLTERIRWQVAFRIAVFMPMAISLFAAGVIWRIMDEKDPAKGTINASIGAIRSAFVDEGALLRGTPSTDTLSGSIQSGFVLRERVGPGDTAGFGLTGIPPAEVPEGATNAVAPDAGTSDIAGSVWRDFKPGGGGTAGVPDEGELGIPGATVELRRPGGSVIDTVKTNDDGGFRFANPPPGQYEVALAAKTFAEPYAGISWLGPKLINPAVMIAYIWVWAGFSMVIIAAGLAAISREVLEAARTDGATEWQVFRRVTAPMLAPVLSVVFITMLINVLKVFDIVLSVAPASSQDDANVIALAMWRTSFGGVNDFGLGSAIAIFLLVLVLPALALNIRRFKREQ